MKLLNHFLSEFKKLRNVKGFLKLVENQKLEKKSYISLKKFLVQNQSFIRQTAQQQSSVNIWKTAF
jgi:hypothetical protein